MLRKIALLIAVTLMGLMITGCSSYKAGKVTDGVYKNDLFTVTTPKGFKCYAADEMGKIDYCIIVYNFSQSRGAGKSFKYEYAANTKTADILVASEDNVSNTDTAGFADIIAKQMESKLLDCTIEKNEDVTVNGVKFRMVRYTVMGGDHQTYYITQSGKKFVYCLHRLMTATLQEPVTGYLTVYQQLNSSDHFIGRNGNEKDVQKGKNNTHNNTMCDTAAYRRLVDTVGEHL